MCGACGTTVRAGGIAGVCPACGAPLVVRRPRPLGTRRAKLIALAVVVVALAVAAGLVAILAPGIGRAKHAQQLAAQRRQAAAVAAIVARERRDQVLHEAVVDLAENPGHGLRLVLERSLESAILSDARARAGAGTMSGPVLAVTCSPYAAAPASRPGIGSYSCLAVLRLVRRRPGGPVVGRIGDPFWGRIDFTQDRLGWCKVTPLPGEMAYGRAPSVPLARVCDLTRPAPPGW